MAQWYRICLQCRRPGFDPWVGKIPWRRAWQPTPRFLPGESHGQRSLAGYGSWGRKESDTTERLTLSLELHGNGHLNVTFISCINFTYHWLFRKVSCVTSDKESTEEGDKTHWISKWSFIERCLSGLKKKSANIVRQSQPLNGDG